MSSRAPWSVVLGVSLFVSAVACTAEEAPSDAGASCRGSRCAGGADAGGGKSDGGSTSKGGSSSKGGSDAGGTDGLGDAGNGGSDAGQNAGGDSASKGGASGTSAKGGTGGSSAKGGSSGAGGSPATGGTGGSTAKGGGSGTGGAGGTGTGGTGSSGDEWEEGRQLCVDKINEYRATVNKAPLERWKAGEDCADKQAANDAASGVAHQGFQTIKCGGGGGQNECPGYASVPGGLLQCLAQMWAEGPTADGSWDVPHGHYMNMFGDYTVQGYTQHFDRVACGFAKAANGGVWSVQNFQ